MSAGPRFVLNGTVRHHCQCLTSAEWSQCQRLRQFPGLARGENSVWRQRSASCHCAMITAAAHERAHGHARRPATRAAGEVDLRPRPRLRASCDHRTKGRSARARREESSGVARSRSLAPSHCRRRVTCGAGKSSRRPISTFTPVRAEQGLRRRQHERFARRLGHVRDDASRQEWQAYGADVVEKIAWPRNNPQPRYPDVLKRDGVEGSFVVEFVVDSTGRVDEKTMSFPSTAHPMFLRAVRDALLHSRYFPAELAGVRVRQLVQQQFSFVLVR